MSQKAGFYDVFVQYPLKGKEGQSTSLHRNKHEWVMDRSSYLLSLSYPNNEGGGSDASDRR